MIIAKDYETGAKQFLNTDSNMHNIRAGTRDSKETNKHTSQSSKTRPQHKIMLMISRSNIEKERNTLVVKDSDHSGSFADSAIEKHN